jgi:hypothetical protein
MHHRLIFYSTKKIKTFTYETIRKINPPTLVQKGVEGAKGLKNLEGIMKGKES